MGNKWLLLLEEQSNWNISKKCRITGEEEELAVSAKITCSACSVWVVELDSGRSSLI